jgi:hypothetical protein
MRANTMDVRKFLNPQELKAAVISVLMENEALNCLPIGLIDTLIIQPDRYPVFHLCALEENSKGSLGIAMENP